MNKIKISKQLTHQATWNIFLGISQCSKNQTNNESTNFKKGFRWRKYQLNGTNNEKMSRLRFSKSRFSDSKFLAALKKSILSLTKTNFWFALLHGKDEWINFFQGIR
jgi:hypothetical protein